jgi:hypothetical protein
MSRDGESRDMHSNDEIASRFEAMLVRQTLWPMVGACSQYKRVVRIGLPAASFSGRDNAIFGLG